MGSRKNSVRGVAESRTLPGRSEPAAKAILIPQMCSLVARLIACTCQTIANIDRFTKTLHYLMCSQSPKVGFIAKLSAAARFSGSQRHAHTDPHSTTRSKYNIKALVDAALLSHTQTSAQTSNGTIKAPDDLCCEKLVETLEPSSRFSQPSHSARSLRAGKAFKLDSQWGSAQSALRRWQNRVLCSFL